MKPHEHCGAPGEVGVFCSHCGQPTGLRLQERRFVDWLMRWPVLAIAALAFLTLSGGMAAAIRYWHWFHPGLEQGLLWVTLVLAGAALARGLSPWWARRDQVAVPLLSLLFVAAAVLLGLRLHDPQGLMQRVDDVASALEAAAVGACAAGLVSFMQLPEAGRSSRLSAALPICIAGACLVFLVIGAPVKLPFEVRGALTVVAVAVVAVAVFAGWSLVGSPCARLILRLVLHWNAPTARVPVEEASHSSLDGRQALRMAVYPMLFAFALSEPAKLLLEPPVSSYVARLVQENYPLAPNVVGLADLVAGLGSMFLAILLAAAFSFLVVPAKWFLERAGIIQVATVSGLPRAVALPRIMDEFLGVSALFVFLFGSIGAAQAGHGDPGAQLNLTVSLMLVCLATLCAVVIPAVLLYMRFSYRKQWARFDGAVRRPVMARPSIVWPTVRPGDPDKTIASKISTLPFSPLDPQYPEMNP